MILPFLNGILSFRKAPVTWLLAIINVVVFVWSLNSIQERERVLEDLYSDRAFVEGQGTMFARFISDHPDEYSRFLNTLATQVLDGAKQQVDLLARLAIRDLLFMQQPQDARYEGDQVQVDYWRQKFNLYRYETARDAYDRFGLSIADISPYRWITYQFVHGSATHLLSNMWFLLIFGSAVELELGSIVFLFFYLFAGILAAAGFIVVSGMIATPLVGASGAVSGLMGLFVLLNWYRPTRFLYWLLPIKGYFGFVYFPTWTALALWSLTDFIGYFGNLSEMGGVAHAAHLSGLVVGLLCGLIIIHGGKSSSQSILAETSGLNKA